MMLQHRILESNLGFEIWGDFGTLYDLRKLVLDAGESNSLVDYEGITTGLAYTIRKAYEGSFKQDTIRVGDDMITQYGFQVEWIPFLIQVILVRTGFSVRALNKLQRSQLLYLEHFVEITINAAFSIEFAEIIFRMEQLLGITEDKLVSILDSRVEYFSGLSVQKRREQLAILIGSFHPSYQHLFSKLVGGV